MRIKTRKKKKKKKKGNSGGGGGITESDKACGSKTLPLLIGLQEQTESLESGGNRRLGANIGDILGIGLDLYHHLN